jgi:ATP-dependent RNA helicase DHX37/DHR1
LCFNKSFDLGGFTAIMPPFKPRDRKQRSRRQDGKATSAPVDTNVTEIIPVSKAEKEAKRQQLREQLREQQPKMSSKKKKRLDKYIVRLKLLVHCAISI